MNVGLFFPKEKENEVEIQEIMSCLSKKDIKYSVFKIGKNWENISGDELIYHLSSITHGIVIPFENCISSRWFSYFVGFFQGKSIQGCVYTKRINVPKYAKFPSVGDTQELLMFIEDEFKTWKETELIDRARENLLNLGIPITVESLFRCVEKGDMDSIHNFLKIGFSVNELSDKGVPLIVYAIRKRQVEAASFFIENKANINLKSKDRQSTPIMEACALGLGDIVESLLEAGADPNLTNSSGQTALIISLSNQNPDIVKILIDHNADKTIKDDMGMDVYDYASLFEMPDITELLA